MAKTAFLSKKHRTTRERHGNKMQKCDIKFKKLSENAKVPSYGSPYSAGADLYLLSDGIITVKPGEMVTAHTGIALEIPDGYMGLIFARSGLATKRGLAPANKVGVIDSDYRGEIMVALYNHSSSDTAIEPGERMAQIVFVPYIKADFAQAEALGVTVRGEGGFGSTGDK